jgi:ribosomal-protein-alanine N-acetyltransferase
VSGSHLATANFRLTPIAPGDRHELFSHLSDPATVAFMDIDPLEDLAGADAIIDWATGLILTGGEWWALRDAEGDLVGTAGINVQERERGSRGEVSYNVLRSRWRRGVMAEVLPAILRHGHDAMGLHRLEALVTPGNVASAAVLRRCGFRREGILRNYGFWKGRFWDQELYARLASDPRP